MKVEKGVAFIPYPKGNRGFSLHEDKNKK